MCYYLTILYILLNRVAKVGDFARSFSRYFVELGGAVSQSNIKLAGAGDNTLPEIHEAKDALGSSEIKKTKAYLLLEEIFWAISAA